MASANLPNMRSITDQLRADNSVVGSQTETFLVGQSPAPSPKPQSADEHQDEADGPSTAKSDVFPFMRAYGCIGGKKNDKK